MFHPAPAFSKESSIYTIFGRFIELHNFWLFIRQDLQDEQDTNTNKFILVLTLNFSNPVNPVYPVYVLSSITNQTGFTG
jgi:hypothetical protein